MGRDLTVLPAQPRVGILRVNEVFGPTIQGEGPAAGRRATFLRLAGCNLSCSWCDTPYSWDWDRYDRREETHLTEVARVLRDLADPQLLVITGGEPMLQQPGLATLFDHLTDTEVHVETNGTVLPRVSTLEAVDLFVVSPKLHNAGDPKERRVKLDVLRLFAAIGERTGGAVFKFVVTAPADVDEAAAMAQAAGMPKHRVWIMPEGATRDEHLATLERVADRAIAEGFNLTTRLHVLAWGSERAR